MSNVEHILKKKKVNYKIHQYSHDDQNVHFAQEAADKLGVDLVRIFKTLVVESDGKLFVGVISSDRELDLKKFAQFLGVKKLQLGSKELVEKTTGYVFGGISPIGQKKQLQTIIDIGAQQFKSIFISAGNRGVEVEVSPEDLLKLVNGRFEHISK